MAFGLDGSESVPDSSEPLERCRWRNLGDHRRRYFLPIGLLESRHPDKPVDEFGAPHNRHGNESEEPDQAL